MKTIHTVSRTSRKRHPGFTLIEVLIALSVLTVGVLGVIGTFPALLDLNTTTWGSAQAATLMEQRIEDLVSAGTFIPTNTTSDSPTSLPNCTRTWVGSADPSGNTNLQFVTVTVQWRERGRQRFLSTSTYLSR